MPFIRTWGTDWLYSRQDGTVTGEELLECATDLCNDERLTGLKYKIVEFIEGEEFDVDAESIRRVAAVDREGAKINPHMKVAIVATRTLIVGMARMYELSVGEGAWETRVFETLDEARQWVGAQEPTLHQ